MPPLPKRKRSKARQGSRFAHSAVVLKSLSPCPNCRSPRLPHRVCTVCGTYSGRTVLEVEAAEG